MPQLKEIKLDNFKFDVSIEEWIGELDTRCKRICYAGFFCRYFEEVKDLEYFDNDSEQVISILVPTIKHFILKCKSRDLIIKDQVIADVIEYVRSIYDGEYCNMNCTHGDENTARRMIPILKLCLNKGLKDI